jgi:hypothetical protein
VGMIWAGGRDYGRPGMCCSFLTTTPHAITLQSLETMLETRIAASYSKPRASE